MQVQRIGYGLKGFYRLAALGQKWEMTPKDAQERLRILQFWERHGLGIRIWLCLKTHSRPDSSSSISVFMSAP